MTNDGSGQNHQVIAGASAMETRAESEEILTTLAMKSQRAATLSPMGHQSPIWTPSAVATPLPPWKRKKIG